MKQKHHLNWYDEENDEQKQQNLICILESIKMNTFYCFALLCYAIVFILNVFS